MGAEPRRDRHQELHSGLPHAGSWYAWLGGYTGTHTDKLSHANVSIPATKTARLKMYMLSYTNDPGLTPGDHLTVQLTYGTTTKTLKTYYNVEATGAYDLKVFDLTPYAGKTVTLKFTATNNADGLLPRMASSTTWR